MADGKQKYDIDRACAEQVGEFAAVSEGKPRSFTRRQFTKAAGVAAAAMALAGSGAFAWFTGADMKVNRLEIAQNLNIRVVEPKWETAGEWGEAGKELAQDVVPGRHIPKNPQVENLSDEFDGWVFIEIRIPAATNVKVFDEETRTVVEKERIPLFTFVKSDTWELLEEFDDKDEVVYRFGYSEVIPAKSTTPAIFEEVVFANLAEAQGYEGEKKIPAIGYGIQSLSLQTVKEAWEAYKKQNGIGDGDAPDATSKVETKLVVNDDAIEANKTYEVIHVELNEAVAITTAENNYQAVFDVVPVVIDDGYKVVEGVSQETVVEFTATEDLIVKLPEEETVIGELSGKLKYLLINTSLKTPTYKGTFSAGETIVFTDEIAPEGVALTDYSAAKDGSVVGWTEGGTLKISTQKKGQKVIANKSLNSAFYGNTVLTSVDLSNLDTRYTTDMYGMFCGCKVLENIVLGDFNVRNVTNTSFMFNQCYALTALDTSGWKTDNVTNMANMFNFCKTLVTLDVSSFDTSNVTDMTGMFTYCTELTSLDVSGFDTSNVTAMRGMFSECRSLVSLDCSDWIVSKVKSYGDFNKNAPGVIPPFWVN